MGIRDALREKASSIQSGAKQDVRRARRAANVDLAKLKQRAKQDVKAGRRKAGSAAQAVKSGAKQDLKKAERTASKKKGNLKRKAKQDVKRADRAVMRASVGDVARKASAVGASLSEGMVAGDATVGTDRRSRTMADRARVAGEARAPVDATLDPAGDPRAIEALATAGYSTADGAMENFVVGGMGPDDGMAMGVGFDGEADGAGFGLTGDEMEGDEMLFADDFGVTGGDEMDEWF